MLRLAPSMFFCDWLQGWMPFRAAREINGGLIRRTNEHGEVECDIVRYRPLRGSHDAAMMVRSQGDGLHFSGSPAKFMLGHNVYGSDALTDLGWGLGLTFAELLEIKPDVDDVLRWFQGDIKLTRIDLTRMYRPQWAQPGWVRKWLAIAGGAIHGGRQKITPASVYEGGTLYVGKGSRRIQVKLYDKAREFARHPPSMNRAAAVDLAHLEAAVADTLRYECQLRSLELKDRKLDKLAAWSPEIAEAILDERIEKLALSEDLRMTDDELERLPRKLLEVYRSWRAGDDLRRRYSRAQFYAHRKELLAHGIDIAHVQPHAVVTEREHAMGRPLKDFLAGGGLEPPALAFERGELLRGS